MHSGIFINIEAHQIHEYDLFLHLAMINKVGEEYLDIILYIRL